MRTLAAVLPPGSRFKGYASYLVQDLYASYLVQDLVVSAQAIRYRRERWITPDGRTVTATPPRGSRDILARTCAILC